jgi:hypothetical protein
MLECDEPSTIAWDGLMSRIPEFLDGNVNWHDESKHDFRTLETFSITEKFVDTLTANRLSRFLFVS